MLSHAPRRVQSALMMLDAFLPEGITELAVDSIFMMPQLGVLADVNDKAATDVFVNDCLVRLGTAVAPIGAGKEGAKCLKASLLMPDGRKEEFELPYGSMKRIPLDVGVHGRGRSGAGRRIRCGRRQGERDEDGPEGRRGRD